jgi:hypothetical protein
VQFLLAAESTKISVISFGKELYKRRERSERPDRFVSNGKYYRILFRSLSEALQIAKCFE